jgi:hypothetical protein
MDIVKSDFQRPKIIVTEIKFVELPLPIRWVEVKQRSRAVVALQDLLVRQRFDLYALEPLVRGFDNLGNSSGVVIGPLDDAVVIMLLEDQTAERIFLEVEEPACPLDVGKGAGSFTSDKVVPAAADQAVVQVPDQFLIMVLAAAKEIDYLKIQVVEDFNFGRFLVEEYLGAAGKRLYVRRVRGKQAMICLARRFLPPM